MPVFSSGQRGLPSLLICILAAAWPRPVLMCRCLQCAGQHSRLLRRPHWWAPLPPCCVSHLLQPFQALHVWAEVILCNLDWHACPQAEAMAWECALLALHQASLKSTGHEEGWKGGCVLREVMVLMHASVFVQLLTRHSSALQQVSCLPFDPEALACCGY